MPSRPLPRFPEPDTEYFWEATKRKELTYQHCNHCNSLVFTPRAHCDHCGAPDLAWKVSKGEGVIYSVSVVVDRNGDYPVAYIDLDEGFRMFSTVVGVDEPMKNLKCGQRVRVDFEPQEGSEYLIPVFRLA